MNLLLANIKKTITAIRIANSKTIMTTKITVDH